MIDPVLALAFNMHANPGVYALLLGSGVSSAAGIPTGHRIVLDLIRRLAAVLREDCEPDPEAWYHGRFGTLPDYSDLLEQLGKTPAERQGLLRRYFEPSEEERERGEKVPTLAHHRIAELVARGYIRVIVTTNFDRLIEQALEQQGVQPLVVSTPDAVDGIPPLQHVRCLVLKVHGDYLDNRIKNSPTELETYDPRVDRLLDRIFDEYGMIVCGWSARWDAALRAAIERCPNRRYAWYWVAYGGPDEYAHRLIKLRRAEVIQGKDANQFFDELAEKVLALEDLDRPHPLSTAVAVAQLKRYLVEAQHRIRLHELVWGEARRVWEQICEDRYPRRAPFTDDELRKRVERLESDIDMLTSLLVNGCYWGTEEHVDLWVKTMQLVANPSMPTLDGTLVVWNHLMRYPPLFLLYAAGMAAVAVHQYGILNALLTRPKVRDLDGEMPLVCAVVPESVMEKSVAQKLPGKERQKVPLNDHLHERLRPYFRELVPDDRQYDELFDRFEYLYALAYVDTRYPETAERVWAPVGRFLLRRRSYQDWVPSAVDREADAAENKWPPLLAGMFGGNWYRFAAARRRFYEFFKQIPYF